QDFLSDGISEDVITALGHFSNLLVIAKSASFQFKDRNLGPAEIGRLLDARYLLEGSVRRAGDRVRVNAELIEAATGRHVWSEAYDTEVKDILQRPGRHRPPRRRRGRGKAHPLRAGPRPRQTHREPRRLR